MPVVEDEPRQVIRSFARSNEEERTRLNELLAPERAWYAGAERFATDHDVDLAIKAGRLVLVSDDNNLRRIGRFRLPEHRHPAAAVTPPTLAAMQLFGQTWRAQLSLFDISQERTLRLAVTSMVRSQAYQNKLVQANALAVQDSTHCTGGAFDVDNSGYYRLVGSEVVAYGHPERVQQRAELHRSIDNNLGRLRDTIYHDDYDERVTQAALAAAKILGEQGLLNVVPEFQGSPNAVLHMAVNPAFVG